MTADQEISLIDEATAAREQAIAPFSHFRVGAAILAADGRVFRGCNIENCSLGLTLCAERVALASALAGGVRSFREIAVVTQAEEPTAPCGACRQLLWEFCGNITVQLVTLNGEQRAYKLRELFPLPFELDPKE